MLTGGESSMLKDILVLIRWSNVDVWLKPILKVSTWNSIPVDWLNRVDADQILELKDIRFLLNHFRLSFSLLKDLLYLRSSKTKLVAYFLKSH
jgi:hypothetical protein